MGFGLIIWSWLACAASMTPTSMNATHCQDAIVQHVEETTESRVDKTGVASFYHPKFVGRLTATGEVFSNEEYTAASNFFKLGTYVKVTNTANGRHIYVKINDRMGHPTRVIDLTERAARDLDFINRGVVKVEIQEVPKKDARRKILAQYGTTDEVQESTNNVF